MNYLLVFVVWNFWAFFFNFFSINFLSFVFLYFTPYLWFLLFLQFLFLFFFLFELFEKLFCILFLFYLLLSFLVCKRIFNTCVLFDWLTIRENCAIIIHLWDFCQLCLVFRFCYIWLRFFLNFFVLYLKPSGEKVYLFLFLLYLFNC